MHNNIELINNFLSSDRNNTLLINVVSEEISCFYDLVIRELANKLYIKVTNNISPDVIESSNDLFINRKVNILNLSNSRHLEEVGKKEFKKIIFTDYKNYKKLLRKYQAINGYDFENDLNIFLKNHKDIKKSELINYCSSYPYLTLSELSKYQINKSNYSTDPVKNDNHNFILQIRKEIFISKKTNINIKELFMRLKKEVKYKKFNFLTY